MINGQFLSISLSFVKPKSIIFVFQFYSRRAFILFIETDI